MGFLPVLFEQIRNATIHQEDGQEAHPTEEEEDGQEAHPTEEEEDGQGSPSYRRRPLENLAPGKLHFPRILPKKERFTMNSVWQPANSGIIRYLERNGKADVEDRPPRPKHQDYWESGSHPDVVEWVWDRLGRTLPGACRRVVCGTPVLLEPGSRILFAAALGTQYGIRLPSAAIAAGLPANPRIENQWSDGSRMNIREEFGPAWIFGSYSDIEETWCRQTFEECLLGQ